MSGICGWINGSPDNGRARHTLAPMQEALRDAKHEAPESIASNGCVLAAESGIRPATLCQSGSLLAAVEGTVRWRSRGLAALATESGPAVALAEAYREHGSDCLKEMSGPFAVVVLDAARHSGFVAIDRLGTRTLCYANPAGQFVFGSNATSVVAHPAVSRDLSRQAIFNYLYFHVIPSPGTIYGAVQKLQPGECVSFLDGVVKTHFYWQLRYHDEGGGAIDVLEQRFRSLLEDATRRAIADSPSIGTFLSGGTDSSTVTAMLTQLSARPARTYSIGFRSDGFDEMKYARITARHFGALAREYYFTPQDVVEAIPIIARVYDEPFGNDSAAPAYFCARMAREDGVHVLLAGDGGDEIFGGNARYAKQNLFEAYHRIPDALRKRLIEPLAFRIPGGDQIAPLRKLRSYIHQASIQLPDRLETYNFLRRTALTDVFEPGFLEVIDVDQPLAMSRDVYDRAMATTALNRMMHLDLKLTLADNDLRKVSRMCDTAGIEVRYPLLDDDLVDFSGDIPAKLKVKGLKLRYFFKHALKDLLPRQTLAKRKHGFGMPFGVWLSRYAPLGEVVQTSLAAFQHRGILQPTYIEELCRQHRTSHASYFGTMIWVIVMLQCWLSARKL